MSAVVWIGLLAAVPAGAAPGEGPGPLPWRVGGRVSFTVDAAAFPDSLRNRLEVYIRIPPVTVAGLVRDASGEGRVKLSVRLQNRFGAKQHDAVQEFSVAAGDSAPGFGKVVVLPFPVQPGAYRMEVKLEDLHSRRRGISYIGRRVAESGVVEGEVSVPAELAGRELSDLEFVWAEMPSGSGAFQRGTRVLLPNPERLYGLLANRLEAAFVARTTREPKAWRWKARVLDAKGTMVAESESTATAAPWLTETVRIDLATQPAGGYDLELKVWMEGDSAALTRRSHFSIAWQPSSWLRSPAELEDIVHFLLEADNEENFARMHLGEQERFLDEFWTRRDPTPGTAENEVRTSFLRRVEQANRNFGRFGLSKGMFSDMGRVYIRYGEPTEILRQVIPAGDQTLTNVIRELELSEDRPTGDVHQKGLGGDTRPFEVWIYEGNTEDTDGAELDSALLPRPRRRMVFLFVDEQGYGDHTLRYSTE
ncbi:MAG TPA: GWxTD domain-containing protein [Candidatus Limnocylindria bacterium]|nr:GWxTD domain-containing protein [Candidatus Limnocylindria bacterium]